MLNPNTYEEIADWCDLLDTFNLLSNSSQQWIFRGQPSSKYPLATKLERDLKDFKVDMKEALRIEGGLLRRFKRQCHHYIARPPEEDNTLEWLALMRHYGAPTRLLDWTYSFFIAFYFALEKAKEEKEPNGNDTGIWECAVWALNTDWMVDRVKNIFGTHQVGDEDLWRCFKSDENLTKQSTFKQLFARSEQPIRMVLAVTPYGLNDRIAAQQGTFLCPGDATVPFEDNLDALRLSDGDFQGNLRKYVVRVDLKRRIELLEKLRRMSTNRTTLFPGLTGFTESLRTLLAVHDILVPDPDWAK